MSPRIRLAQKDLSTRSGEYYHTKLRNLCAYLAIIIVNVHSIFQHLMHSLIWACAPPRVFTTTVLSFSTVEQFPKEEH